MALDTGYVISAQKVTKLPVSDVVIKRVEQLAKNQASKILKFANRRGKPIFDASLIAGVDYDENLVPPNALDAEQEEEEQEEDQADEESEEDSGTGTEEEEKRNDHWEKDEEDLEIQNESNQKIHHKDGDMVEDKDVLDDPEDDSAIDSDEDDPKGEEDQASRSESDEPESSEESEEDENTGPRRSTRTREPPERLNPNMTGQSYATKKMNVKVKRKIKKDIKLRTKRNSEKSIIICTLRVTNKDK